MGPGLLGNVIRRKHNGYSILSHFIYFYLNSRLGNLGNLKSILQTTLFQVNYKILLNYSNKSQQWKICNFHILQNLEHVADLSLFHY